jgi:hypothetical protein
MRNRFTFHFAVALLFATGARGHAANLVSDGVLGNSGEAGQTLVRFGGKFRDARSFSQSQGLPSAPGLGVALDRFGFLWDRGGEGVLNRYAVDGRLIGQYKIPSGAAQSDQIALLGDTLILQLRNKLYALAVTAPAGSEAKPLNRDSQAISFGSANGRIASLQDGKIYLLDAGGNATEVLTAPEGRINGIELLPDGTIAIDTGKGVQLYESGVLQRTQSSPGGALQFIDGFWYGHTWHGTTKRFDATGNAAPGVVLGGASGSFIGHLDGNYEINNARGLAKLSDRLFAISGLGGVLHLLQWQDKTQRFEIVRRIGSVAACRGLALDDKGNVRYNFGIWKWSDGPAAPQDNGSPIMLSGPAASLPNGALIAPGVQYGSKARFLVLGDGEIRKNAGADSEDKFFTKGIVGSATTKDKNQFWLLFLASNGAAREHRISSSGDYTKDSRDVHLVTATPVKEWTGLAAQDESTLLAAADGFVIELQREGEGWKETRRWNSWGEDKFGPLIRIAVDAGRLWVSDTARHRVLCFDVNNNKLLANFGTVDRSGDDLSTLSSPTDIAARGDRAVVYDSGNQRIVKLSLR